jgi:hypothetical protein
MDSADRLIYSAQVISHVDHAQMIQPTKCLMNTCAVQLQLARGIIEERGDGVKERRKEAMDGMEEREGHDGTAAARSLSALSLPPQASRLLCFTQFCGSAS